MNWWGFARKPSVHERRQKAVREGLRLAKRGQQLSPVVIEGRAIARNFWGKAWCGNLESYRDYEYRLPRGRSYVRNRAVLDLRIASGQITALVSGSQIYETRIAIAPLGKAHWGRIKTQCAGHVGSLIELLEGRLSERVMRIVSHRDGGLFPKPAEIQMSCSCPDWATMCKHVAAVMYGVGARLDHQPELLFTLRGLDHAELITQAADFTATRKGSGRKTLADEVLGDVFGIELDVASRARPQRESKGVRKGAAPDTSKRSPGARKARR